MKTLVAVDPSINISGYAVFINDKLVSFGEFKTGTGDVATRLCYIKDWIGEKISLYPDYLVVEDVEWHSDKRNALSLFKLSKAIGVFIGSLKGKTTQVYLVKASTWKRDKRTHRVKSKQQTIFEVNAILQEQGFEKIKSDHEADAICIGSWAISKLNIEKLEIK